MLSTLVEEADSAPSLSLSPSRLGFNAMTEPRRWGQVLVTCVQCQITWEIERDPPCNDETHAHGMHGASDWVPTAEPVPVSPWPAVVCRERGWTVAEDGVCPEHGGDDCLIVVPTYINKLEEQIARRRTVAQALASIHAEGGEVTYEVIALSDRYVSGELTIDQLLEAPPA